MHIKENPAGFHRFDSVWTPTALVLDENGKPLHTQNTALLEKGNGYSFDKVKDFLVKWAPNSSQ